MRKICVVSATRAEWYLLKNLCEQIRSDRALRLQLILTGAHLSANFGLTYKEIEREFKVAKKIPILLASDDKISLCKAMSLALSAFGEAFGELKPDLLVILGDRYEMLAVASAALMMGVGVAHLCGGELTLGAIDDSIRHAITKMSHLHFTESEIYKKRVLQLGEEPWRVFNSGSLNGEIIKNSKLLSKNELQNALGVNFAKKFYLITYHPETLSKNDTQKEVNFLLKMLDKLPNATLIFTKANADENGLLINSLLAKYCAKHAKKAFLFDNLGSKLYLSTMKHAAAVVGNSSSGIAETPFLRTPCINIGSRQAGRLRAENIIDTSLQNLPKAFARLESAAFQSVLKKFQNPFEAKNSSKFIKDTLKSVNLQTLLQKNFVDKI